MLQRLDQFFFAGAFSGRKQQKIAHGNPAKADGLLKGIADAQIRTVGHAFFRDILPVKENLPRRRTLDPGNQSG